MQYEPSIAPSVFGPPSFEQPEGEGSPPVSANEEDPLPPENDESMVPLDGDFGGIGTPIPDDDGEEDGLFSFGDDHRGPPNNPGIWEINIHDMVDVHRNDDIANGDLAEVILLAATTAKKIRSRGEMERT